MCYFIVAILSVNLKDTCFSRNDSYVYIFNMVQFFYLALVRWNVHILRILGSTLETECIHFVLGREDSPIQVCLCAVTC
jgi:hypothetical protein